MALHAALSFPSEVVHLFAGLHYFLSSSRVACVMWMWSTGYGCMVADYLAFCFRNGAHIPLAVQSMIDWVVSQCTVQWCNPFLFPYGVAPEHRVEQYTSVRARLEAFLTHFASTLGDEACSRDAFCSFSRKCIKDIDIALRDSVFLDTHQVSPVASRSFRQDTLAALGWLGAHCTRQTVCYAMFLWEVCTPQVVNYLRYVFRHSFMPSEVRNWINLMCATMPVAPMNPFVLDDPASISDEDRYAACMDVREFGVWFTQFFVDTFAGELADRSVGKRIAMQDDYCNFLHYCVKRVNVMYGPVVPAQQQVVAPVQQFVDPVQQFVDVAIQQQVVAPVQQFVDVAIQQTTPLRQQVVVAADPPGVRRVPIPMVRQRDAQAVRPRRLFVAPKAPLAAQRTGMDAQEFRAWMRTRVRETAEQAGLTFQTVWGNVRLLETVQEVEAALALYIST